MQQLMNSLDHGTSLRLPPSLNWVPANGAKGTPDLDTPLDTLLVKGMKADQDGPQLSRSNLLPANAALELSTECMPPWALRVTTRPRREEYLLVGHR